MRPATPEEIGRWDELVSANPDGGDPLQGRAFAETKAQFGFKPFYGLLDAAGKQTAVLYLTRPVWGLGELKYVPKGPGTVTPDQYSEFITANKADAGNAFVIKSEPQILKSPEAEQALGKLGLVKVRDIQFNQTATVLVDLRPSEDEILASFRQKTRYNVRYAEKHGVLIEAAEASDANLKQMYALMQATRDRAGFYLRSYDYFETFWKLHAQAGSGQLFFAKYEGKVLAGDFVTFLGKKGLYKDGGSTREHSNLQAPYLLQWEVMRFLKNKGVEFYDLHGVPPADRLDDESHPLHSLVLFKTGFNSEVTEYVGTWDLPLSSKYGLWTKLGERAAMIYSNRVKKQLFY